MKMVELHLLWLTLHLIPNLFAFNQICVFPDVNLNGVWNLVLACPDCNRGSDGKFAKAPAMKYVQRLHKRNEFLISSHHPLRETIMDQTGRTEADRTLFLKDIDKRAINILIHRWETPEKAEPTF